MHMCIFVLPIPGGSTLFIIVAGMLCMFYHFFVSFDLAYYILELIQVS